MTKANCFNLRLEDFESNIRKSWQKVKVEQIFCDVTFACEDKMIEAHKLIVSFYSPVLQNMLIQNKNPHPLIYLSKVRFKDLQSLLEFMYQGEISIFEEDLPTFLELARDFKIIGLSEARTEDYTLENKDILQNDHLAVADLKRKRSIEYENKKGKDGPHSIDFVSNSKQAHTNLTGDHYIESEIQRKKVKQENHDLCKPSFPTNDRLKQHNCAKCDPKQHICAKCDKEFEHRGGLWKHEKSIHEGRFYYCDKCEYKTHQKTNLQVHIENSHEGVRHYCTHCDYKGTSKGNLQKHLFVQHNEELHNTVEILPTLDESDKDLKMNVQSETEKEVEFFAPNAKDLIEYENKEYSDESNLVNYEDVNVNLLKNEKCKLTLKSDGQRVYVCDKCDKEFNHRGGLWKHERAIHIGIFYFCDLCDYKSPQKVNLKKHIENKHEKANNYCNNCDYKSATKVDLQKHILIQHYGDISTAKENLVGLGNYLDGRNLSETINEESDILESQVNNIKYENKDYINDPYLEKKEAFDEPLIGNQVKVQLKEAKIEEGQKQYVCEKCDKIFYHRGGLWKHMKAIHEGISYFCDTCDYKSTQKVNLQKHVNNKHLPLL